MDVETPAATFMTDRLRCVNKSVHDLNYNLFLIFSFGYATCRPLLQATFNGPPLELESLGPGPGHSLNYQV